MLHKCLHPLGLALCIHRLMWRFYPPTIGARSTFFDVPVRRGRHVGSIRTHWSMLSLMHQFSSRGPL